MSTKGRTKFSVAGMHPLLTLVRDHFIYKGFALVPWGDEHDFSLIGADIGEEEHPPLAQLELQKMQVGDKPVLLLSTPKVFVYPFVPTEVAGARVYALAAEYMFGLGECLSIRPYNVYGPDVHGGLVHNTIGAARRGDPTLKVPSSKVFTSFLHQDDFLKIIDKLLAIKARGVMDVGSAHRVTYGHTVHNIWQFVAPTDTKDPTIEYIDSFHAGVPELETLEQLLGWLPKTSVRSGVFKML